MVKKLNTSKVVLAGVVATTGLFGTIFTAGCNVGGDTPTKNAPLAKGAGGIPLLNDAQLRQLPPDKQAQIRQSQQLMQQAASANLERKRTGQMPNGG